MGSSLQISHREAAAPTCTPRCPHHVRPPHSVRSGRMGLREKTPLLEPPIGLCSQGRAGLGAPVPPPAPDAECAQEHAAGAGHAHHHQVRALGCGEVAPGGPHLCLTQPLRRDKETSRDEFIFYSKRLMRLLIEHALSFLPFQVRSRVWGGCPGRAGGGSRFSRASPRPLCAGLRGADPAGTGLRGQMLCGEAGTSRPRPGGGAGEAREVGGPASSSPPSPPPGPQITGVSILRAGETMEPALRAVCKDVRIGTILIQTNQLTGEPEVRG